MEIQWNQFKKFIIEQKVTKIDVYLDYIEISCNQDTYCLQISNDSTFDLKFYDMCKEQQHVDEIPIKYYHQYYLKKNNKIKRSSQISNFLNFSNLSKYKYLIFSGLSLTVFIAYKIISKLYKNKTINTPEFDSLDQITGMNSKYEITDVLNNLDKIEKLGGKTPRGFLLKGPPGVGKTMIARIIAKQSKKNFYQINASEFSQPLVGAGSKKIRDLIKLANTKSPSIIFIDEIDSIAKKRCSYSNMGLNQERESILNELLTAMDGFKQNKNITFFAATNRAELLDKALLRPGRFDRHIDIKLPNKASRLEIAKYYINNLKIKKDIVDKVSKTIANITKGFTPADIKNLVNEAAINAAVQNQNYVYRSNFINAFKYIQSKKPFSIIKNLNKYLGYCWS